MSPGPPPGEYRALRERAVALVARAAPVDDATLLAHVYGAAVPVGARPALLAPLLAEPRLRREPDGTWRLAPDQAADPAAGLAGLELTALATLATGPRPERHRLVGLAALHWAAGRPLASFRATLRPGRRLPRYVAARGRIAADGLDAQPTFADLADDLVAFLGSRPLCAQEVRLARAFLAAELERADRPAPDWPLLDLNRLAEAVLDLPGKPTLAAVAAACGVGYVRVGDPDDEARVVGEVADVLLRRAQVRGLTTVGDLLELSGSVESRRATPPLRDPATAHRLPDRPGVYVLRDAGGRALYVGSSRRLDTRLAAYTSRPLGATRRLEGLAEAVAVVEPHPCPTDLEALILEDRLIRELRPRFNTVRRLHDRPTWLRLPPEPAPTRRSRRLAPPRLQLTLQPEADGGAYLGPFRNGHLAAGARDLARAVFALDEARRGEREAYHARLASAWRFLAGDTGCGVEAARAGLAAATAAGDRAGAQYWRRLLDRARAFALDDLLLPTDPRSGRYAVLRPTAGEGVELLLVDAGRLVGCDTAAPEALAQAAADLLAQPAPRTGPDDTSIVLRWLGGVRPPARLFALPADDARAVERVADAAARLGALDDLPAEED